MWFATEGTVKRSLGAIHKTTESKWLILVMKILEKETLLLSHIEWMVGFSWRNQIGETSRERNYWWMSVCISILLFVQAISLIFCDQESA